MDPEADGEAYNLLRRCRMVSRVSVRAALLQVVASRRGEHCINSMVAACPVDSTFSANNQAMVAKREILPPSTVL